MTNCIQKTFEFPALKKRKVVANFDGGSITSDGGGNFLRMADRQLNLLSTMAKFFSDNRDQSKVNHSVLEMLRQRVYGIALGYEDLNDHKTLRKDIAFQAFVNSISDLASSPTLCRFENGANRKIAIDITKQMVETFISSHKKTPKELVLDFDATDDLIHGNQEGGFYHGYYKNYCFLPLYVFCGKKLLVSYLRTSKKDGARHTWAILSLLVKRFRQEWPDVKIIFRGDSGFCRHQMITWCEKKNVDYIIGVAQNKRLNSILKPRMKEAEEKFEETKEKQRLFSDFLYAAGTWTQERRIIGKAEHTEKGSNPRYVVTNLAGNPQELYDKMYCARGDMENRIKEQQLGLFAGRTSCCGWWPNQLRLIFSSLAYIIMEHIRSVALVGTELENAQMSTIRLKLFKIGAIVIKNTRRIKFLLSSFYPLQDLFALVCKKLVPI
ncbi:MAG: IS1380 family transposase [Candidatus Marinimicrobia bacterium]|nr:IS1380 family transposase [Candidatus Neomarinimicrobiota bacterium]